MKRFLVLILIALLICPLLPPARAEEGASVPAPSEEPQAASAGTDAPAAEPSAEPEGTPEPESISEPQDTPAPNPAIRFLPEEGLPLPCEAYPLTEKRSFAFGGTVESEVPLSFVSAAVSDLEGNVLLQAKEVPDPADEAATHFLLWDKTFPFEDESLSGRLDFASLAPGQYVFTLKAANEAAGEVTLYIASFTVTKESARHTLIPNDLRDTYPAAEAYVGEGGLPLSYFTGSYGQIWLDSVWVGRNLVYIDTPFGDRWRVNKAAVEPFQKAIQYMRTTYIHVGGKWNSGITRLFRLMGSYNGPFYGRLEENTPFISPHVLGLSVDLNRHIGINNAVPDNWAILCREVSENLIYNGIREKNGLKYYDFTYIGNWGTEYANVPTVVLNYLLYELAFYRAGFFWGAYYDHTCDASHFGLGEFDPEVHTNSPLSLRKVFEYIDE